MLWQYIKQKQQKEQKVWDYKMAYHVKALDIKPDNSMTLAVVGENWTEPNMLFSDLYIYAKVHVCFHKHINVNKWDRWWVDNRLDKYIDINVSVCL